LCRRSVSRLGDSALFLHIVHSSSDGSCRRSVCRPGDSAFPLHIVHCVAAVSPVSGTLRFLYALFIVSPQCLPSLDFAFSLRIVHCVAAVSPVSGTLRFFYTLFTPLTIRRRSVSRFGDSAFSLRNVCSFL